VATHIEAAAFTARLDQVRAPTESVAAKMPVSRCAHLMLSALTRQGVDESWISANPILLFVYLAQYCPTLAREIGKRFVGPLRTKAFRAGVDFYDPKAVANAAARAGGSGASNSNKQE